LGLADFFHNRYCFSCGRSDLKKKRFKDWLKTSNTRLDAPTEVTLPDDYTAALPADAQAWLYKNHFTPELIEKYRIGFSETTPMWSHRTQKWYDSGPRVILPYYIDDTLQYFEARSLDPTNNLKYVTAGSKKELFRSGTQAAKVQYLVIVEDMLSAMRVGEHAATVALRGTKCPDKCLVDLYRTTNRYILWLDSDEPGQKAARKLGERLTWAGKVRYIKSELDPKCYSAQEIEWRIKNAINDFSS
jgi:DNA primase